MAKLKSVYVCKNCGAKESKWVGRCPSCGEWNSFEEVTESVKPAAARFSGTSGTVRALTLDEVTLDMDKKRTDTGNAEFNRVLGGGLVPGSLILLGGEPGIGTSTLVLQIALNIQAGRVLYFSGEESVVQIKMRAERLEEKGGDCLFLSGNSLEVVLDQAERLKPDILVIDSIQTIFTDMVDAMPGTLTQIRECTGRLLRYAKENSVTVILIGHITKDGQLAGPKVLEHMVDTVLQFEGDRQYMYRILRSIKNRFGSTSEIGIYEMLQSGLRQVSNPSELLLSDTLDELSGVAIAATVEGIRPLLLEVQALVSTAAYGVPQRTATGFDTKRLNMLLAVLEKRVGFKLSQKDVFINIAGGIKVSDPAMDLAVAMSILSSNIDMALPSDVVFAGEVGLSGEIRAIARIEQRVAEAEKLGFKKIYVPSGNKKSLRTLKRNIEIESVNRISDLCRSVFR